MRIFLKILNPFIALINYMRYTSHLENQKFAEKYEPYDFSKDIKYF